MINSFLSGLVAGTMAISLLAHSYYTEQIERIYAEVEAAAQRQDAENLEQQLNAEREALARQGEEERQAQRQYADTAKKYNSIASGAGHSADDRVQQSSSDHRNSATLPTAPGASCKTSDTCDCRRARQAYAALKQQCAALTRERDELATDRNELIHLYNQIRANYGHPTSD